MFKKIGNLLNFTLPPPLTPPLTHPLPYSSKKSSSEVLSGSSDYTSNPTTLVLSGSGDYSNNPVIMSSSTGDYTNPAFREDPLKQQQRAREQEQNQRVAREQQEQHNMMKQRAMSLTVNNVSTGDGNSFSCFYFSAYLGPGSGINPRAGYR